MLRATSPIVPHRRPAADIPSPTIDTGKAQVERELRPRADPPPQRHSPLWAPCVPPCVWARTFKLVREWRDHVLLNFFESFVDNVFRDAVTPVRGSVLYCDFGHFEHSGIYIGDNLIVQLTSTGAVEYALPHEFIQGTTAISIYVSCIDENPVGHKKVADRAETAVGSTRDYSIVTNNCHIFCSECLTGRSNADTGLWMLKHTAEQVIGVNTWRVWDIGSDELF